ncbi:hypothetical protein AL01_05350 [Bombella intestini]|uniref:Uncharacterized protein n=1 Tax=Bombella intestini TaxID=1539051 RepID=A0A1S8GPA4_9PROT|nr:hypothetical protein AL01_05350 [Bombella intestini]
MKTILHKPAEEPISPPASFRQLSMEDCVYVGESITGGSRSFRQRTAEHVSLKQHTHDEGKTKLPS